MPQSLIWLCVAVPLGCHVAFAGDHGSTFAGNPLVCATACTVFDIISDQAFLDGVVAKGERLRAGLRAATAGNKHVKEVRQHGWGRQCVL